MSVESLMPQYVVENKRAISLQLIELNSIDSTREKWDLVQDLVPAGFDQGKKIRALPKPLSLQGAVSLSNAVLPPGATLEATYCRSVGEWE